MADEVSPGSAEEDAADDRRLPGATVSRDDGGLAVSLTRRRRRRVVVSALGALVLLAAGGGVAIWLERVPAVSHGSPQVARGVGLMPPAQQAAGRLLSVSVASATSAWAVGVSCELCGISARAGRALIMHWSGTTWSSVRSPSPGGAAELNSVSSGPGGQAWAVGWYCLSDCGSSLVGVRTLIMHWDGTAWSHINIANPGGPAQVSAVSAGPVGSTWAVGYYCTSACGTSLETDQTLLLRWSTQATRGGARVSSGHTG